MVPLHALISQAVHTTILPRRNNVLWAKSMYSLTKRDFGQSLLVLYFKSNTSETTSVVWLGFVRCTGNTRILHRRRNLFHIGNKYNPHGTYWWTKIQTQPAVSKQKTVLPFYQPCINEWAFASRIMLRMCYRTALCIVRVLTKDKHPRTSSPTTLYVRDSIFVSPSQVVPPTINAISDKRFTLRTHHDLLLYMHPDPNLRSRDAVENLCSSADPTRETCALDHASCKYSVGLRPGLRD